MTPDRSLIDAEAARVAAVAHYLTRRQRALREVPTLPGQRRPTNTEERKPA